MADGGRLYVNGSNKVIAKLKEFTPKLKAALMLDAENVSAEMEEWAKANAPWTDRTSDARNFLKSHVLWENTDKLMISMSHHVDYGVFLELCNAGKYAILESAIAQYKPEFVKGWKEIISSQR